jgi:hypothetical protein
LHLAQRGPLPPVFPVSAVLPQEYAFPALYMRAKSPGAVHFTHAPGPCHFLIQFSAFASRRQPLTPM